MFYSFPFSGLYFFEPGAFKTLHPILFSGQAVWFESLHWSLHRNLLPILFVQVGSTFSMRFKLSNWSQGTLLFKVNWLEATVAKKTITKNFILEVFRSKQTCHSYIHFGLHTEDQLTVQLQNLIYSGVSSVSRDQLTSFNLSTVFVQDEQLNSNWHFLFSNISLYYL